MRQVHLLPRAKREAEKKSLVHQFTLAKREASKKRLVNKLSLLHSLNRFASLDAIGGSVSSSQPLASLEAIGGPDTELLLPLPSLLGHISLLWFLNFTMVPVSPRPPRCLSRYSQKSRTKTPELLSSNSNNY